MDRSHQYKQRFGYDSMVSRLVRGEIMRTERMKKRDDEISWMRHKISAFNINNRKKTDVESKKNTREEEAQRIKLQRWKAEREVKRQLAMKNRKPAFIVGIPHHNYFSPTKNDVPMSHCHSSHVKCSNEYCKCNISISKKKPLTPATLKRLAAKQSGEISQEHEKSHGSHKKKQQGQSDKDINNSKMKSFAPSNYRFKAPSGIYPLLILGATRDTVSEESKFKYKQLPIDEDTLLIGTKSCIDSNKTYTIPTSSAVKAVDCKLKISQPTITVIPASPCANDTPLNRNKTRTLSPGSSIQNNSPISNVIYLRNRTVVLQKTPLKKYSSNLNEHNNCSSSANASRNLNNAGYDVDKQNNLECSVASDCNRIQTPRSRNICFRRDYYRDIPSLSEIDDS